MSTVILAFIIVTGPDQPLKPPTTPYVYNVPDRFRGGHFLSKPIWEQGGIMNGGFSYYDKGPTDWMIEHGLELGVLQPEDLDGRPLIAHANCGFVGREIWVSLNNGPWEKATIFDCAGSWPTIWWMSSNRIMGEIDHYTAEKLRNKGQTRFYGRMSYVNPN